MTIAEQVAQIARDARQASFVMSRLGTTVKNNLLLAMAEALRKQAAHLIAENARDLEAGKNKGLSSAMLDRLLHHGHVLKFAPRSWRTKTELLAQAG